MVRTCCGGGESRLSVNSEARSCFVGGDSSGSKKMRIAMGVCHEHAVQGVHIPSWPCFMTLYQSKIIASPISEQKNTEHEDFKQFSLIRTNLDTPIYCKQR